MARDEMKVAVVTGANRGIGREVARQLVADHGYAVVLCGRTLKKAKQTADELRQELGVDAVIEPAQLDVTSDEQSRELAKFVRERFGKLHALVNNAGAVLEDGWPSILDSAKDTVLKTVEINTTGALGVTQALMPLLLEAGGGRIVMVSSGMASLNEMGSHHFAYRVSKAGLNVLTLMLHAELADKGLRVNSVCPGFVRTELTPANAQADREIPDGARGIVWAATLGPDGPAGGFFRDGEPVAW